MITFSKRIREIGIISIILIILLSFSLLIHIQNITDHEVKENLFSQQKQRQIQATSQISQHIGSDLNLVIGMLDGLANSKYLQDDQLSSDKTKKLLEEKYSQFSNVIDRLFILNKDNIVTMSLSQAGSDSILNNDFSFQDWVIDTRKSLQPVFSGGFERVSLYSIYITIPIINRDTNKYIGIVGTSILTEKFFANYGNINNINRQFLVAYDKNGIMLANGASETLIGQNFFGDYTQKFINHNSILNNLTHNLLAGNSGVALYDYGRGERLTTQYPIFVNGKPIYFIQVVTPFTEITSQAKGLLAAENSKMFMLLGSTIAAISVLIIILIKWTSSLDMEVKRRTKELDESNKQLAIANEQLTLHDKMQKEFINVAAHELKTPIQPIISLAEHLRSSRRLGSPGRAIYGASGEGQLQKQQQDEIIDVIIRNAIRLRRLAENILDVTKIESQTLFIKKERFNLNSLIFNIITDFRNQIARENKNIKLELISNRPAIQDKCTDDGIFVDADKDRITQVISNLLNNAIKCTKAGTVTVVVDIRKEHGSPTIDASNEEVIVTVRDSGSGVDPEILPRLFTKFATKSYSGTGLGLFISKNIIESHGGKIWLENGNGKNNKSLTGHNGAIFSFSLPTNSSKQLSSKLMGETRKSRIP